MKDLTQEQKDRLIKIASRYVYDASTSSFKQKLTISEKGILAVLREFLRMDEDILGTVIYKGKIYETGNIYNELVELYEAGVFVMTVSRKELKSIK